MAHVRYEYTLRGIEDFLGVHYSTSIWQASPASLPAG